jgi:protein-S-isoprenylcysteine O-methyltransferase Ste14
LTPASHTANQAAVVATAFLAAEIVASLVLPDGRLQPLRYVGAACGVAALPLMFLPMFTLRRHGDVPAGDSYMRTTRVVERGLFRVVRHPQYVGYILLAATFAFVSQHPVTIALAVAALAGIARWTVGEEGALRDRFGAEYDAYAARVPRFNVVVGLFRLLRRRT